MKQSRQFKAVKLHDQVPMSLQKGGVMRTIKFRLIKDNKIVGYERHILNANGQIKIQHSDTGDIWLNIIDEGESFNCFIEHDDKNQFIGPKDRNGKEIWESDLSKLNNLIYSIEYECGKWVLVDIQTERTFDLSDYYKEIEIIGNIFEK